MVQTKKGAGGNAWIDYMRVCAANYRAGQTQHHSVEGRPAPKRRIPGKQPESTNLSVAATSMLPKGQGKAAVKRRVTGKQPAK